jgi:hypothetical protein
MNPGLSPWRWFRRRAELRKLDPRRLALQAEISRALGTSCVLDPARSKDGYDQIYHAVAGGRRLAVIRLNNPYRKPSPDVDARAPLRPLAPAARLTCEWEAYSRLFPLGLSPQPLWRTDDAIACSWLAWGRASAMLIRDRSLVWPLADAAFSAVRRMHEAGTVHLDLNLGNLLFDADGSGVAFIDFEYGPARANASKFLSTIHSVLSNAA